MQLIYCVLISPIHQTITYFLYSFPLCFITGYWTQFSVLYSSRTLFIHSIYYYLYLLTPNSQFIPPSNPSALATSVFCISESVFLLQISSFVSYFRFHIRDIIFVLLHLMIVSRSIHVVANGNISSFLQLSSTPLFICTTSYLFIS